MRKITHLTVCLLMFTATFSFVSYTYAENASEQPIVSVSPTIIVPTIIGDKEKFEEDHWLSRNTTGGIGNFEYSKSLNGTDKFKMDGHALAGNNDYGFESEFARSGVGNLTFEFEQYRKYFDGTGGWSSIVPVAMSIGAVDRVPELHRDLHLDIGKVKLAGVLEKEDLPLMHLSWERERKNGVKSSTSWSSVTSAGGSPKIYPIAVELDEVSNVVEMGIAGEIKDVKASIDQTIEHVDFEINKAPSNFTLNGDGSSSSIRSKTENLDFDQYNTVVRLSKQVNEKVFSSLGILFNHYTGGTFESIWDTSTSSTNENEPNNLAGVEYNVVTLLKNFSFTPTKGVMFNTAFKAEFTDKRGTSTYNRDKGATPDGVIEAFKNIKNDTEKRKLGESLEFNYSRIKDVVLFAQTDFEQEKIRQFENLDSFGSSPDTSNIFSKITDTHQYNNDLTVGSKWYASRKVNITTQYKFKQRLRNYDNVEKLGDTQGYRGFIDSLDIYSHIPSLRLNYKPNRWLAYNFFYSFNSDLYKVRTMAADAAERAKYKSNVYSIDMTLSPRDYLYFDLLYQKTQAVTHTGASTKSGSVLLPAYNGDNDVVTLIANYAPNNLTTLTGSYSITMADNFDPTATWVPLGLDNYSQNVSLGLERKLNDSVTTNLKYAFSQYDENSNGGVDDYEAHIVYAGLKLIF